MLGTQSGTADGVAAWPGRLPWLSQTVHNAQPEGSAALGRKQPDRAQREAELPMEGGVGQVAAGDLLDPVEPIDHRVAVAVRQLGCAPDGTGRGYPSLEGVEQ